MAVMDEYETPCVICNERHKGSTLEYKGHDHQNSYGVGSVRLLVIGAGMAEYCWRCSCIKSGWSNVPNAVAYRCDGKCVCHTAERCD